MRGPGLSRCKVATPAGDARDDRRQRADELEREAWLAFKQAIRGLDVEQVAHRCGASRDAVESWITRKRRIPARALVAVGVVAKGVAA